MLRRLFWLVVLVAVLVVGWHYWTRYRVTGAPVQGAAREFEQDARELGAEAKEKFVEVREDLRDVKITGSVKTALSLNRSLNRYPIKISTENRVVTLRGRVESEDLRARIEGLVAEVPDVLQVVNQIELGAVDEATAAGGSLEQRAVAAQRALDANASLRGLALHVRVEAGRLVLSGQVSAAAEKDLAGVLAREAAGMPVENGVTVPFRARQ